MELFRNRHWDIIGKTPLWFAISGATIVLGLAALLIHGLNYGIDFTGGSLLRFEFSTPLAQDDAGIVQVTSKVRGMLDGMKLGSSEIQIVGDQQGQLKQLYLRTPPVANDEEASRRSQEVVSKLKETFADKGEVKDLGRETVGPVVGEELRNKAILALLVGYLLILVYISIRYEFRFGVAAVISLGHDILVVLGCMALFRVELNSAFVAALLTVLGYSNHDTVVIMDRIRENMRVRRRATFAETVNASLLETMARSVNLVLVVLITVVSLLIFGGEAIRGFSLALIFGITTGCYSSIFMASPILVLLEGRGSKTRAAAVAVSRGRSGGSPRPERTAPRAAADDAAEQGAAPQPAAGSRRVIEQLQKEELAEREQKLSVEADQKREERRDRRKREKDRSEKRGGKPKRRF